MVGGASRDALSSALLAAWDACDGTPAKLEYKNRPAQPHAREQRWIAEYGSTFYAAQNVKRDDAKGRKAIDRVNYTFFGAPLNLVIHAPANAAEGRALAACHPPP